MTPERVVQILQRLSKVSNFDIINIVGSSKYIYEYSKLKILLNRFEISHIVVSIDKLSLRETADIVSKSAMCLSNDSGIAHLAAALSIPVVVLSSHGKTMDGWHLHSPKRYHPWGVKHEVIQPSEALSGCEIACTSSTPHCINQITNENVIDAITRVF
jgi:ADP-heptose:LPS heptosyltransferase